MNIIVLTSFLPDENEVILKSKNKPISSANSTFQKALIRGLSDNKRDNNTTRIINVANVGCYPFNYNSPHYKGSVDSVYDFPTIDISFFNISYIKHICIYKKLISILERIISPEEETTIICYDLYWPFIKACSKLKQSHKIKIVSIVPDIPELTGSPNTFLYKIYSWLPHNNVYDFIHNIDGFVLLTESMKEVLKIESKPYIIIEGIYDKSYASQSDSAEIYFDKDKFNILYSGALNKRNGLEDLIESVTKMTNIPKEICLHICGAGELSQYIIEKSATNPQIKFWGQISRDKVLEMQRQASLLINPRKSDEEFAKYSFPSKTMEYMASGTPVLMYRLNTLPIEYEPYLFFVDSSGLEVSIERIMNTTNDKRGEIGSSARDFILREKNETTQAARLLNFVNNISKPS